MPCASTQLDSRALHRSRSTLQVSLPLHPGLHLQEKRLTPSVHVPPCLHGDELHSFTSVAHVLPLYPFTQSHLKLSFVNVQVAPCTHGDEEQALFFLVGETVVGA